MKSKVLEIITLVAAIHMTDVALAQTNSPTAGGSGGSSFSVLCGVGEILVGVKGTSGNYITSIQGICASINEILMPVGAGTTSEAGGSASQPFEQRCPSGHAIRGLRVATGLYVDSLRIRCGRIVGGGNVDSFNTHPLRAGGGGGDSISNLNCPGGLPASGLVGRSGSWIDRIGLRCESATVANINASGANPDLRVAIRDYPSIVTRINRITFRVELWNVGSARAPAQRTTVDITTPSGSAATFQQDPNFALAATCNTTGRCTSNAQIRPGRRMVIRISMAVPRSTDPIAVSARADVPEDINELNETNNFDEQELRLLLTQ